MRLLREAWSVSKTATVVFLWGVTFAVIDAGDVLLGNPIKETDLGLFTLGWTANIGTIVLNLVVAALAAAYLDLRRVYLRG